MNLRIEDVAIYNPEKEMLSVEDEFYVPKYSLLWSLSKEGVEQKNRTEIKMPIELYNRVKGEVVYYPTDDLKKTSKKQSIGYCQKQLGLNIFSLQRKLLLLLQVKTPYQKIVKTCSEIS